MRRIPLFLIFIIVLDIYVVYDEVSHGLYKKAAADALIFAGAWMLAHGLDVYLRWKFHARPPHNDEDPGPTAPGLQ